jgi:hypothetical protein
MLAGSLLEAGVFLGNVYSTSLQYNRKGLMEPKAVLFMHEDLLKVNGGSWSDPPDSVEWKPLHLAVRDLFIESRAAQPIWGFKDPRTLLTLEGWQSVLPSLELVGIFRHPLEVAVSMRQRNGFHLSVGVEIWRRYNERLMAAHERHSFPVIEFHADPELLREKLALVVRALRLPELAPTEFTFFEDGIRQSKADEAYEVPAPVMDLYHQLRAVAL